MAERILELVHLSKRHTPGKSAVNDVSLHIDDGARLAIVGETGSGKSTLLKMAAGLVSAHFGKVLYRSEEIENPDDQLIAGHPDMAYLSQHFELPKFISVEQYLFDPYEMTLEEAERIYTICQIEHLLGSDTRNLSGGEKQRVALAKLLLASPEVLLLDEPFSNLDPIHKRVIKEVIQTLGEELSQTIILVSHEPLDVLPWADRIVVMKDGQIVQQGKPHIIYNKPIDEYVAGLFGKYNLINPMHWGLTVNGEYRSELGSIIVRPEAFRISKNGEQGFNGEVLGTSYFGGYEEVEVLVRNETLILRTKTDHFTKGQKVKVSLSR